MTISAALLGELHRILRQLTDLRSRLQRGPKQISAAQAHVEKVEQELLTAKEEVKRTRMNSDQKELQLKEREGRILDVKAKLNSCSSNREYQAFVEQIAADEQANSVLQDEILELLDKITGLQESVEEIGQRKTVVEQELATVREKVESAKAALETDVARLTQELSTAEDKLPEDLRRDYDRIVKAKGEDALAVVEGDTCGGCYQTLTTQTINELMMAKPLLCRACGCILYMPEKEA